MLGTYDLFDDSFRRRTLHRKDASGVFLAGAHRGLQAQASGCLCPINTDPDEPAAPTEGEFRTEYDAAVTGLNRAGTLVNVAGVSDIQ